MMKKMLYKNTSLLLVTIVVLIACNESNQKKEIEATSKEASSTANGPCDTGFIRSFKKLTAYNPEIDKEAIAKRAITDERYVIAIKNNYYSFMKFAAKIDTVKGLTDPRLCLGVDFNGTDLTGWINDMNAAGATNIKVMFGVYDQYFLNYYQIRPGTQQYTDRINRLTAVLVAYNSQANFVGAYNLGGMQP